MIQAGNVHVSRYKRWRFPFIAQPKMNHFWENKDSNDKSFTAILMRDFLRFDLKASLSILKMWWFPRFLVHLRLCDALFYIWNRKMHSDPERIVQHEYKYPIRWFSSFVWQNFSVHTLTHSSSLRHLLATICVWKYRSRGDPFSKNYNQNSYRWCLHYGKIINARFSYNK